MGWVMAGRLPHRHRVLQRHSSYLLHSTQYEHVEIQALAHVAICSLSIHRAICSPSIHRAPPLPFAQ